MKFRFIFFCLTLMTSSIFAQMADAAQYVVDPAQSELVVQLFKAGVASSLAHDHVIRATNFSGKADVEFSNPAISKISVEAQANGLKADEPGMRQKYQLQKKVSDNDRKKIQQTMESANQMDIAKFPTIEFHSTDIQKLSDGQYLIKGVLDLHGQKRPISFPATIVQEDDRIHGKASFHFKQSDFGITPYSSFLGAVRNKDEAAMNVDLVLVPQETGSTTQK